MSSRSSVSLVSPLAPFARFVLVASGAGLMILTSLPASASDQSVEYFQARNIALKDPKVQAAFQKAGEKLDERIVEIDPSLKSYVEKHRSQYGQPPTSLPTAKPLPVVKKDTAGVVTHVVAKGETLSSIAVQYKVSVASLKSANHITDERKLRAGQKLVIPGASAKSGSGEPKSKPGFWDRLRDSLS